MTEVSNRLDIILVKNNLVSSREKAKNCILNGFVSVNGRIITKPSFSVKNEDEILCNYEEKFVSRGGYKLEALLEQFSLKKDFIAVDVGASTGGFTQCLLNHGAKKVYAVDVGHNQLNDTLVNDYRVINMEGTDIRNKDAITKIKNDKIDFCSVDVSFISLGLIIHSISELLEYDALAGCLIKPQFEVGKKYIGKNGIVKDKKAHKECIISLMESFKSANFSVLQCICSPITGGDGNIEYLVLLRKQKNDIHILDRYSIEKIVNNAFETHKKRKE